MIRPRSEAFDDPAGDQALALGTNDRSTHGDSPSGHVEVRPGNPERFTKSQAGREHEPRQLGRIMMLRGRVGIEYPQPLANLLQGERPSGSIAIEFQWGEVANGIARESTTPHQPTADPRQYRPGELGRRIATIDEHRLDEAIQAWRGHFAEAERSHARLDDPPEHIAVRVASRRRSRTSLDLASEHRQPARGCPTEGAPGRELVISVSAQRLLHRLEYLWEASARDRPLRLIRGPRPE